MGKPFEIDTVRLSADQLSFAIAGTAADQHDRALYQLFGKLYGGLAQRFIAPDDQRVIHASFFQPLLDDMRTLAAARPAGDWYDCGRPPGRLDTGMPALTTSLRVLRARRPARILPFTS